MLYCSPYLLCTKQYKQMFPLCATIRLESIMLQNLLIMLFGISPIFCLLCSFLCFLGMHYADNLLYILHKNDHDRNKM